MCNGVELALNAVIVDKKKFGLNFNFNVSYNKNKIDELNLENPWQSSNWSGSTISKYEDFRVEQGGRLGELWGYKMNGYYTVYDPATGTGDLVLNAKGKWELADGVKDKSKDIFGGTYYPGGPKVQCDENGNPIKQRLGNTVPTTTGGFGFDGHVGNFDFNVFFNYSLGNKIVNGTKLANAFYSGSNKKYNLVDDFTLDNRYTWIDPNNGLNLGKISTSTITTYGGTEEVMARLNELNQGKSIYNPATVTAMQLTDYADRRYRTCEVFLSNSTITDYYDIVEGGVVILKLYIDRFFTCKNVKMLSYQDTYYSNNNKGQYYFEGSDIHGIVDFICGGGDVFFNKCTLTLEPGKGSYITAPYTDGTEGKTQVNFNASLGYKKVTKLIKTLDPYNFAYSLYEVGATNYGNYSDLDIWKSVEGTDYQDEVFGRTGNQKQYNVSVSGGTKDIKYNIGFSHNDEKSIMLGSGYAKNNVNAKLNANLNKWLSLDFNARMAFTKLDGLNGGADTNESNAANSIVANTVKFWPVYPLTDSDEDEENSTSVERNPIERIYDSYKYQERFQQNYNVGLNWKPFKNITLRSEFGYRWDYNNTDQVWGSNATTNSKYGYNGQPQAVFTKVSKKNWRNANTITYDNSKLFGGRDHINVLLGQEWSSSEQTTRNAISVAYPASFGIDDVLSNTGAGTALPNEGTIAADENILSYFGRINYTLNDKYLVHVLCYFFRMLH
jgi:hypothetical protein